MRIISGILKGRQLLNFKADHIRPTTDRVKESIFNRLMGEFEEAKVLDLFSGTGNLSIESYSRGAQKVIAVELNKKSIQIMKKNLDHFKIRASEIQIVQNDVLQYIKKYNGEPFQVILIDPPFTQKMAHEVMEQVITSKIYNENTTIMIESSSHERMDDEYGKLKLQARKDFGDKWVSFFSL